jgi:hypothetical protein
MIGSFMDESFDMAQSGMFAVGGLLGRGVALFELERRWENLLKRPDINIPWFKASACERAKKPFDKFVADSKNISPDERAKLDSISHEFIDAVIRMPFEDTSYLVAHGIGVNQDDFYDVIKDPAARSILGSSPFRLTYDLAMIQCSWIMKQLRTGDTVAFVCDECEEHSPFADEAYRNLKRNNPSAAAYMAGFTMDDEKKLYPLQAADVIVFEVRRALSLALGQRKGTLRRQFEMLIGNKTMHIIQHATKENLLKIVANHKPGDPFKLDEIMEQTFEENIKLSI